MNKPLKKNLFLGYVYGVFASLVGTTIFALINTIIYLFNNGWENWTSEWNLFAFYLVPGSIVAFIPGGLGGCFLSYRLWIDKQNDDFSKKKARHKGGLYGIIVILILLIGVLISPLSSVLFRMSPSVAIRYLVLSLALSYVFGKWVGNRLSEKMLG